MAKYVEGVSQIIYRNKSVVSIMHNGEEIYNAIDSAVRVYPQLIGVTTNPQAVDLILRYPILIDRVGKDSHVADALNDEGMIPFLNFCLIRGFTPSWPMKLNIDASSQSGSSGYTGFNYWSHTVVSSNIFVWMNNMSGGNGKTILKFPQDVNTASVSIKNGAFVLNYNGETSLGSSFTTNPGTDENGNKTVTFNYTIAGEALTKVVTIKGVGATGSVWTASGITGLYLTRILNA